MYDEVQIFTMNSDQEAEYRSRVLSWEQSALDCAVSLKERYMIWQKAREYSQLQTMIGASLYNRNESLQKSTDQLGQLLGKMRQKKVLIVPVTSDGGSTYELAGIDTATYKAILASKGLNFGALFALGIIMLEIGSIAIAGIAIYKGLEYMIEKLKAENSATVAASTQKIADVVAKTATTNPALASKMTDAFQRAQQAAEKTSNQSWFDKLTEGAKSAAVSGFGGLALGLFLALMLSRKRR